MSNRMIGEGRTYTAEEWQAEAESYLDEALGIEQEFAGLECCEPMVNARLLDAAICENHARVSRLLERQEELDWLRAQPVGIMTHGDSWCRQ